MKTATFKFKRVIKLGEGINTGYGEEFYQNLKKSYREGVGGRFTQFRDDIKGGIIKNLNDRFRRTAVNFFDENQLNHLNIRFTSIELLLHEFDDKSDSVNSASIILSTDIFTVLDSVNDNLLLTIGDATEKVKNYQKIEDTFFATIPENVTMAEYTPL